MGLHSTPGDSPRNAFASCVLKPNVFLTSTRKVPYDCVCVVSNPSITSFRPEKEQMDAAPSPNQNPSIGVAPPRPLRVQVVLSPHPPMQLGLAP